jgi:hypothetical protein
MSKTAICILSRNFNETWMDFLKTFTHYDLYMVVDDNTTLYDTTIGNVTIIQVPDNVCTENNYYKSSCWSNLKDIVAWDRALYYFNRVNTNYDHIWFMEDDVFIAGEHILRSVDEKYPTSDLLCAFHEINETGNVRQGWNHWVNVIHRIGTPWAHSMISCARLSNRLLKRVDDYVSDRHLMFIEALFNTLALHHGYAVDNPEELKDTIAYDTKWNRDEVDITKIYHPFKKMEDHVYIRDRHSDK